MKLTYTLLSVIALLLYFQTQAFSQSTKSDKAEKPVYEYVEKMPAYNGGQEAMLKYLSNSIQYTNAQVQGLVVVSFVVDSDSSVNQVKVLKGLDPQLDSVCVQSVRNMSGHWTPGYKNGKPVAVRYTLPVRFNKSGSGGAGNKPKEEMPEYKGGSEAFKKFMNKNVKYPKGATKHGVVYVAFVINEDGTLSNYEVKKSIEPKLDEEALRLAKLSEGNWLPGEQNGQKVKVHYTMPVVF